MAANLDRGDVSFLSELSAAGKLQKIVENHPLAIEFQQRGDKVQSCRSVLVIKPEDLPNSLVYTTLAGDDTIIDPYVFNDDETGSILVFYHLGRNLAGHAGIVHGGIVAVLLDECMGRASFPQLPAKTAVTARLEIDYKSPITVDSIVLIQAEVTEVQGRKAWVEATVKDAVDGRDHVKATGLFVQPKWASDLSKML